MAGGAGQVILCVCLCVSVCVSNWGVGVGARECGMGVRWVLCMYVRIYVHAYMHACVVWVCVHACVCVHTCVFACPHLFERYWRRRRGAATTKPLA